MSTGTNTVTQAQNGVKTISLAEIAKHDNDKDCFLAIHGQVYDITKFLDEHPGGAEIVLDHAGKDASDAFEDVGHSQDARNMLKDYLIGQLPEEEAKQTEKKKVGGKAPAANPGSNDWTLVAIVAVVAVAAIVAYKIFN